MNSGGRNIGRFFVAFSIVFLSFSLSSTTAFASQAAKDRLNQNDGQGNICSAVKTTIAEGMNIRDVVRTAIELGNSPCLVVKCALYGGGDLKEVILGAMEAGATSDVVSRCAIDAGANPRDVSASLLLAGVSVCYFEPEGLPYTPQPDSPAPFDPIPKPNPDPPLSPSGF